MRAVVPAMVGDDYAIRKLRRANLTPDDIEIVVNAHLHGFKWEPVPLKRNSSKAKVYAHVGGLAMAWDLDIRAKGSYQADREHSMPIIEVTGGMDLFAEECILVLPLPGH